MNIHVWGGRTRELLLLAVSRWASHATSLSRSFCTCEARMRLTLSVVQSGAHFCGGPGPRNASDDRLFCLAGRKSPGRLRRLASDEYTWAPAGSSGAGCDTFTHPPLYNRDRIDCNLGTGHVTRCIVGAQALGAHTGSCNGTFHFLLSFQNSGQPVSLVSVLLSRLGNGEAPCSPVGSGLRKEQKPVLRAMDSVAVPHFGTRGCPFSADRFSVLPSVGSRTKAGLEIAARVCSSPPFLVYK